MPSDGEAATDGADKELESRIDTFMGEFRMLTPGIAALFGFQLTVAFQASFDTLSPGLKALNFVSLACSAAAFLLLLVPAHHHRFIHRLAEDEEFLRFAKRFIGAGSALVPVAIALTLALQAIRAFDSVVAGGVAGAVTLVVFGVLWWAYPWAHTRRRDDGHLGAKRPARPARPRAADEGLRVRQR